MTATQFVTNKEIRVNATGVIKGGKMYVLHQGKEIPEKEFRKLYPLPEKLYSATENPNKKTEALS